MILREVTFLSVTLRLLAAVIFGGIIGMERGLKNRPAGLRTYMLVCVGSCLIMLTNQYLYQVSHAGDPMRLGAQVVSGIGFLGAGTIIVTKHNQIKGLTTAAGLWACAGVGLALGVGFYEAAVLACVMIYFILTVLHLWDSRMRRKAKFLELYIEISESMNIGALIRQFRAFELEVESLQMEPDSALLSGFRSLTVSLKSNKRFDHSELIAKLHQLDGFHYLEEL